MENWKLLADTPYRAGYRHMLKRTFELPTGKVGDFDILKLDAIVCALALTPEGKVVMTRQFRPGPQKVLLELPGGMADPDEEPMAAAERELIEETGYRPKRMEFAGTHYISGYATGMRYIYIAYDCVHVQEPEPDEFEIIETTEMTIEEFRKHVRSGALTDAAAGYIALDYLGKL